MKEESNRILSIISDYINKELKRVESLDLATQELKKLDNFLKKIEYIPTPDLYIELLKSSDILNNIVKIIVNDNYSAIVYEDTDKTFNDLLSVSLIDAYCVINNIEIEKISDEEFYKSLELDRKDNDYVTDGLRAYINEIKHPLLTREEEQILEYKISQGDEKARQTLIERNLLLVVSIAKQFLGRGVEFLDLIQEGNIGLVTAVDRFDITKECRISTYATYWIKQCIRKAIENKGKVIGNGQNTYEKIRKYKKIEEHLEKSLGRVPTIDEISNELHLTRNEIIDLYYLQQEVISTNALVVETAELEELLTSDDNVEDITISNDLVHQVEELLKNSKINEKKFQILIHRFGLFNQEPKTLEDVGKILGIGRERVRQLEAEALRDLKREPDILKLANYTQYPEHSLQYLERFQVCISCDSNKKMTKNISNNKKQ